jgi:hypothetical protein
VAARFLELPLLIDRIAKAAIAPTNNRVFPVFR